MTTPFYFGPSRRPLFGIYHPPSGGGSAGSSVVICPPIGHEYMRTHRALRTLAVQLARAGHGVVRFDWSGTGDSAGDPETASVADWLEDLAAAIDEARELVAAPLVSLVGLRLGATLARLAAAELQVGTLVLWDPVVSGKKFLDDQAGVSNLSSHGPSPGETMSLISFPVTRSLWDSVAAIDLLRPNPCLAERVALILSEGCDQATELRHRLVASKRPVRFREISRQGDWDDMDRLGATLLPRQVLEAIGEELA